jgi:hypothetical protein
MYVFVNPCVRACLRVCVNGFVWGGSIECVCVCVCVCACISARVEHTTPVLVTFMFSSSSRSGQRSNMSAWTTRSTVRKTWVFVDFLAMPISTCTRAWCNKSKPDMRRLRRLQTKYQKFLQREFACGCTYADDMFRQLSTQHGKMCKRLPWKNIFYWWGTYSSKEIGLNRKMNTSP